jgi:hypothetical protein
MHRQADGEIQLKDTGDALIDKWEEQIAEGMEPDLWEAFSDKEREKLKAKLGKEKSRKRHTMKDVLERVERDAQQQGFSSPTRENPTGSKTLSGPRFNTFGNK